MVRATTVNLSLAGLILSACAAVPPAGPDVLALPPTGKDLAQFQREDAACRGYAQQQSNTLLNAGPATTASLQQRYDISYAQCMAASGNRIQPYSIAYGYAYPYAPYQGPGSAPRLASRSSARSTTITSTIGRLPITAFLTDFTGADG